MSLKKGLKIGLKMGDLYVQVGAMYGEIDRPGAKGGTHTKTSHDRLGVLSM